MPLVHAKSYTNHYEKPLELRMSKLLKINKILTKF